MEEVDQSETRQPIQDTAIGVGTRQQTRREATLNRVTAVEEHTPHGNRITNNNTTHEHTNEQILQTVEESLISFRRDVTCTINRELRNVLSDLNLNTDNRPAQSGQPIFNSSPPHRRTPHNEEILRTSVGSTSLSTEKISNLINNWHVTYKGASSDVL